MKRSVIIIACLSIVLIGTWIIIRVTGIFTTFEIRSSANKPALKVGQHIFTSNLIKPKKFDFITFKNNGEVFVYRLIGMPGDTIQLKNGLLFINNKEIKEPFHTSHNYIIPVKDFEKLVNDETMKDVDLEYYVPKSDSIRLIELDDEIAKKQKIYTKRFIQKAGERDKNIGDRWSNDYNTDNFGPVIVPSDSFFVLGDNRHNAADSRYLGFIPKSRFVSTVFNF